eukprot:s2928_g4.t1
MAIMMMMVIMTMLMMMMMIACTAVFVVDDDDEEDQDADDDGDYVLVVIVIVALLVPEHSLGPLVGALPTWRVEMASTPPHVTAVWVKEGVAGVAIFNGDSSCQDVGTFALNLARALLGDDIKEQDGLDPDKTPLLSKSMDGLAEPWCSAHYFVVSGSGMSGVGVANQKKARLRAAYVAAAVHYMAESWKPDRVSQELQRRNWDLQVLEYKKLTHMVQEAVRSLKELREGSRASPERSPEPQAQPQKAETKPEPTVSAPPSQQPGSSSSTPPAPASASQHAKRCEPPTWLPESLDASDVRKTK